MKRNKETSEILEVIRVNEPSEAALEEFYQAVVRSVRKALKEGRLVPEWVQKN